MNKFGLIGGTSWHSTVEYYRLISQRVNGLFGNNTNPPLWIANLNQQVIHTLQQKGDWEAISKMVAEIVNEFGQIGVQGLALCSNTLHKILPALGSIVNIPFVHIGDSIGSEMKQHGWDHVGLLGTSFTMKEAFIRKKLMEDYHVKVIVPDENSVNEIQRYIVEEFSLGYFSENAKRYFKDVIHSMNLRGAQATILGCTEIPLLLQHEECSLPVIDSLQCHCESIVNFIMKDTRIIPDQAS